MRRPRSDRLTLGDDAHGVDAPPAPTRRGRTLRTLCLLALVLLLVVDAAPELSRFHGRLKALCDPLLDVTGLWQGSWRLYAPNVDKANVRLTAQIHFADGTVIEWTQPRWAEASGWQKFLAFRKMEYFDTVARDSNRAAWPALAAYLAREAQAKRSDGPVVQVKLLRASAEIPRPGGIGPLPFRPYVDYPAATEIFTWGRE